MEITIANYDKMTLKELEKEHLKENQILLDMINMGCYSKNDIDKQKSIVDYLFNKIRVKHQIINDTIGHH